MNFLSFPLEFAPVPYLTFLFRTMNNSQTLLFTQAGKIEVVFGSSFSILVYNSPVSKFHSFFLCSVVDSCFHFFLFPSFL